MFARAPLVFVIQVFAAGVIAQAPAAKPASGADAPAFAERLLVCNKGDRSLSIFDPATREQVALVPTGEGPHEVAVAPDGRTAVVADYGAQKPGSTLTVVDLVAARVDRTIELHVAAPAAADGDRRLLRPHGIRYLDGDRVVFTSEVAHRLVCWDLRRDRPDRTWSTPQATVHMVALSPDGATAHATSIKDGDLAMFDLRADGVEPIAVVPTGDGAEGIAVNPANGEVWVGNRAANTVSVVDAKARAVVATIATGDFPFRIAFTPDGARALVSCAEGGDVQVFDAVKRTLVRAIAIGADGSELSAMPMGICVDADGKRAFVACGRGEFVAVLDLTAGRLAHKIPARAGPDGIAFARVPRP